MSVNLETIDDPEPDLVSELSDLLYEHNCRASGTRDYRTFAIVLRHPDGSLRAGAAGWTRWGWLHLDLLWVEEALRGQGVGTSLLVATERIARERGCTMLTVDTASFQAPDFYRKRGFQEIFALDIPRHGFRKFQFRKDLPLPADTKV